MVAGGHHHASCSPISTRIIAGLDAWIGGMAFQGSVELEAMRHLVQSSIGGMWSVESVQKLPLS